MTAQELAHVDEAGEGETEVHLHLILNDDFQSFQVELTWEDLKGSCMVLLRPRSSFRNTATNDNFPTYVFNTGHAMRRNLKALSK